MNAVTRVVIFSSIRLIKIVLEDVANLRGNLRRKIASTPATSGKRPEWVDLDMRLNRVKADLHKAVVSLESALKK